MKNAEWTHIEFKERIPEFSVDNSFEPARIDTTEIPGLREYYLKEAEAIAEELEREMEVPFTEDESEVEELKSFYYVHRA